MSSQPARVAIDLETTGLRPDQDAIIEIGAVKFAGDEVLGTFETCIAPGIPLPYRIQRLTGITPAQLRGAPSLVSVLPDLRAFLGDLPLVGHNVAFDVGFLRRVGLARRNPQVDTYELASALLPGLKSYSLANVATALGVTGETHHRALADAQLSRQVLLVLLRRLEGLDVGVLEALAALPAPPEWTFRYFLRQQVRAHQPPRPTGGAFGGLLSASLGEQLMSKLDVNPEVLALAIANDASTDDTTDADPPAAASEPPSAETPSPTFVADIAHCLDDGGVLAVELASTDAHLLAIAEAAVRWSARTGERALLVAGDMGGMRHLSRDLLPLARTRAGITPEALPIAELAEREAYLCLHRWFGAARLSPDGPLTREVTHGLAKMICWLRETRTGLRAEVALPGQEERAWELVRSGAEFADGWEDCPYRRDGYCFADRAEAAAQAARIVVMTQAALAQGLARDTLPLTDATRVIILESSLLEEELRRATSTALERDALLAIFARLATTEPGGKRAGLLHLAAERLGASASQTGGQTGGQKRERAWTEQVTAACHAAEGFFQALRGLLTESAGHSGGHGNGGQGHGQGDSGDPRFLRLDDRARRLAAWQTATAAWDALAHHLEAVATVAREAARALHAAEGRKKPLATSGIAVELLGIAATLERTAREGAAAFETDARERDVSWLRVPYPPNADTSGGSAAPWQRNGSSPTSKVRGPTPSSMPSPAPETQPGAEPADPKPTAAAEEPAPEPPMAPILHRARVHVGALLAPLHAGARSLVLAGPALAVGGEFEQLRGAMGLPDATRTLSIMPDCAEQTLLALPSDVPEPNSPHYQRALEDMLVKLGVALGGGVVALFPSHAALRASAVGIRRALERQDVLVLAQGIDGSARQLWQNFSAQPRVLLLGAGGFWSGREQGERPPACVVVARMPFPALSDPLLAARAELWEDSQAQFVVPQAALKLRQALNGLAWSHTQRNAVVLFDRRLQTRGYGQTVLGTLPRCTQRQEPAAHLAERIAEWVEV